MKKNSSIRTHEHVTDAVRPGSLRNRCIDGQGRHSDILRKSGEIARRNFSARMQDPQSLRFAGQHSAKPDEICIRADHIGPPLRADGLGRRIADGATWPEWRPGNEFKAKRDAMLKKP